jgi:uncharacterized protein YdiU (UPF0061 family)
MGQLRKRFVAFGCEYGPFIAAARCTASGHAIRERATVITRIAPTFLRFGSFEIFKPTDLTTGVRE